MPQVNAPIGKKISKKDVVKLVNNYKKGGGWQGKKTKSVWFSHEDLAKIKQMVDDITTQSGGQKKGDGVRIYFAKYGNKEPENNGQDLKNRETLVFVPTYHTTAAPSEHVEIISKEEIREILDNGVMGVEDDPGDEEGGYNHGRVCPEDCGGANLGNEI